MSDFETSIRVITKAQVEAHIKENGGTLPVHEYSVVFRRSLTALTKTMARLQVDWNESTMRCYTRRLNNDPASPYVVYVEPKKR